ncbi:MAG: ferrous iron transport protein A [Xylanivirga thermophila]|jgi:ferrous iron transport protein A|uniref:FeoA family protein n=1 Tax=Xylanivirga thermophila TaxID=2496273 RepID=UPI0039F5B1A9
MATNIIPLSCAKSNTTVVIKRINGGKKLRNRLMELGIIEGAEIDVLSNSGGPLIIMAGNSRFALGQGMAQKLLIDEAYSGQKVSSN